MAFGNGTEVNGLDSLKAALCLFTKMSTRPYSLYVFRIIGGCTGTKGGRVALAEKETALLQQQKKYSPPEGRLKVLTCGV